MGTPEFALPTLHALADAYDVVGVVTQPDRPAGRGLAVRASPVKLLALELCLPVIEPPRLTSPDVLADWAPELIVVAAYGRILRSTILDLPRHGCVNVHASLLPRWRGAAPVPAAILAGDPETGVTIMQMDAGMDTGPILAQRSAPVLDDDTSASLSPRLARLGSDLLMEVLPDYLAGRLSGTPQDGTQATYAPPLAKRDGILDPAMPADELARRVRAMDPWPGAHLLWQGRRLRVLEARAVQAPPGHAGRIEEIDGLPAVVTPKGLFVLEKVQLEGRNPVPGDGFMRGARGFLGGTVTVPDRDVPRSA
jgi:methionyl-tRNA formyltransferase